jgi:uncharacterized iron-regulated membrane protein
MRWLLLILLISLLGLLFAALGLARHIWRQRTRSREKTSPGAAKAVGPTEETDVKTEL